MNRATKHCIIATVIQAMLACARQASADSECQNRTFSGRHLSGLAE